MTKDVLLSTLARKQYSNLGEELKIRIKNALNDIAAGNKKGDVKKLKGLKGRLIQAESRRLQDSIL